MKHRHQHYSTGANGSSLKAKDRLKTALAQDRIAIPPATMQALQQEMITVISKYLDLNAEEIVFSFQSQARQNHLIANIPVAGLKARF